MTEPERVTIVGPYGLEGGIVNAQELTMYNAEGFDVSGQTDTKSESPQTSESDETILTPIEGQRSFSLDGVTVPNLLNRKFGGSTPTESLRNWLYSFEALVLPQQGLGYEIQNNLRSGSIKPDPQEERGALVEQVRWSLDSSEIVRAEWDIDLQLSEGVQEVDVTPQSYIEEQQLSSSAPEDGVLFNNQFIEFTEVETRRVTRSINLTANDLMHDTDVQVVGLFDSGVQEEVEYDGRIVESDDTLRKQKAQAIDEFIHGNEIQVSDTFTNRVFKGTPSDTTVSFENGFPNSFDFRLSLEVGATTTD